MVPWTMVPFFSSICTVSLVSFMRNLQIKTRHSHQHTSAGHSLHDKIQGHEREESELFNSVQHSFDALWCRSAGPDPNSPHKLHHDGQAPLGQRLINAAPLRTFQAFEGKYAGL